MTELARIEDVHFSERGLELGAIDFERWEEIGRLLGRIRGSLGFWVGDWLLYGERAYGERYAQAVDVTGLDPDTLRGFMWVAERIPPVRRRTSLSFSAHREVAALPPAEADALLDKAEAENLGSRDLRRLIRERRELTAGLVTISFTATHSDLERWQEKAEGRRLEDVAVELLNEWADAA